MIFLIQSGTSIFKKYTLELKPASYLLIIWIAVFPTYFLDDSKYYYSNLSNQRKNQNIILKIKIQF